MTDSGGESTVVQDAGEVDRRRDEPLWHQIVAILRQEILDSGQVTDTPLPSEAELCDRFGVSRNVVRQALRELEGGRLIYRVKGQGSFVASAEDALSFVSTTMGSDQELRATGRTTITRILHLGLSSATPPMARDLRIDVGDPVVVMRRLRWADGEAVLLVDTQLPAALVPGLEERNLDDRSLYDLLRRDYGLVVAGADRWIQAVRANAEDAPLLEVDTATPLLGVESIAWDEHGRRFERYQALHNSANLRFYVGAR